MTDTINILIPSIMMDTINAIDYILKNKLSELYKHLEISLKNSEIKDILKIEVFFQMKQVKALNQEGANLGALTA